MAVQTQATQRAAGTRSAREQRSAFLPYFYTGPALFVMAFITFFPVILVVYLSFLNLNALNLIGGSTFVGFRNYSRILGSVDAAFYSVLGRTFVWTLTNIFFHVVGGVFLALLLNQRGLRLTRFYRTVLILPWAVPTVVSALMARTTLFDYNFGAFNQILAGLGFERVVWLTDARNAFIAVIMYNVWAGIPFMMMVASSALASIPDDVYEAAHVDGASPWQQLWSITLPMIRPTMVPSIILGTIWTFNNLLAILLITQGGPSGKTDILLTYLYRMAFLDNNFLYSLASAVTVVAFFILLGFVLLNVRLTGAMKEEA